MKSKRTPITVEKKTVVDKKPIVEKKFADTTVAGSGSFFNKSNFVWMLAGLVVMIIGFLLMAGGRSEDPNVFNKDEVYSTTRITIAPILILAGLAIEVFAIFRNPEKS
ncbi:MAG: DUF3098 domain-containing protein [Chitinophagaceae bacterium]